MEYARDICPRVSRRFRKWISSWSAVVEPERARMLLESEKAWPNSCTGKVIIKSRDGECDDFPRCLCHGVLILMHVLDCTVIVKNIHDVMYE